MAAKLVVTKARGGSKITLVGTSGTELLTSKVFTEPRGKGATLRSLKGLLGDDIVVDDQTLPPATAPAAPASAPAPAKRATAASRRSSSKAVAATSTRGTSARAAAGSRGASAGKRARNSAK